MNIANCCFRFTLLTALVLATHACSPKHGEVSIAATPAHTTVRYLDDIEWKQRTEFGRAYSDWTFLCTQNFDLSELKEQSKGNTFAFEIKGVDIKLGLELIQTLPYGVKNPLRKHEEMHCAMTAECYKDAEKIATNLAKTMLGKKIVITDANDVNSAHRLALIEARRLFATDYKENTSIKADKLAVIFDRVTNHGLNGVSNEDGRKRSIEEYERDAKQAPKEKEKEKESAKQAEAEEQPSR